MVGISTAAILYLTVTCYKLFLAGSLKSPIFHNLLNSYVLSREFAQLAVKGLAAVSKIIGKDPLLSEFNIYMLSRNNEFDCSKAKRELGFRCRPFSESIRDTVNWLRVEGFLETEKEAQILTVSPRSFRNCSFLIKRRNTEMAHMCQTRQAHPNIF